MGKKRTSRQQASRLNGLYNQLQQKNITVVQARQFNAKEWKQAFGLKKTLSKDSLEGQKKLLKQLQQKRKDVITFKTRKFKLTRSEQKTLRIESRNIIFPFKNDRKYSVYKIKAFEKIDGKYKISEDVGVKGTLYVKARNVEHRNEQLRRVIESHQTKYKFVITEINIKLLTEFLDDERVSTFEGIHV